VLEDRTLPSTFTVTNLLDSGAGTLRQAILGANSTPGTDTITFSVTGTINLAGALPNLSSNLSIQGPGADSLSVRRNTGGEYRIFTVTSGATVAISGLTVTNGRVAFQGGGIANAGTLTLSNVTVSGNLVHGGGGDLDFGGGIHNSGTLTVQNSTITGNVARGVPPGMIGIESGSGGGIYNEGNLTVTNSTVSANTASGGGGIMNGGDFFNPGTATVSNSTIAGNEAYDSGGGLRNGLGTLTVTDSTVANNLSSIAGGGIDVSGGTVTIRRSTIAGNTALFEGGGIYHGLGGTLILANTIVAGNAAESGRDIFGEVDATSSYNLIGDDTGLSGISHGENGNQIGTAESPINPLLGPLQNNGGSTQTRALLSGSPAINAGDPAQLGVADQRGVVRARGVNIGAYQASASAFALTAPATVTAGVPFTVVVQAVDSFGKAALGYTGTVIFTATDPDPAVVLPAAYTFTAGDPGAHTFSGGFTLLTPGEWVLTATDAGGWFNASITVWVNA
jgi:hypothetical protein